MTPRPVRNNNENRYKKRKIRQRTNWRYRHTSLSVLEWSLVKRLYKQISSVCEAISRCAVLLSTLSSMLRTTNGLNESVLLVYKSFYVLNIHLIQILMLSLSQSASKVDDIMYAPLRLEHLNLHLLVGLLCCTQQKVMKMFDSQRFIHNK